MFPGNVALIGVDLERFAARQAARGLRLGWRAVPSHHDQFGALAAALVAERLGLPGAAPGHDGSSSVVREPRTTPDG